jgi:hypothetical protein
LRGMESDGNLVGTVSTGEPSDSVAAWQPKLTAESLLRQEVGLLEKQKDVLLLSVEELKLKHERAARRKAIDIAQAMIQRSAQQAPTPRSLTPVAVAPSKPLPPPAPPAHDSTAHTIAATPEAWCRQAAAQFGIRAPVAVSQVHAQRNSRWGNMEGAAYREAWTAHGCDLRVFGTQQQHSTSTTPLLLPPPPPPRPAPSETRTTVAVVPQKQKQPQQQLALGGPAIPSSFSYLSDNSGRPRRRVTVNEGFSGKRLSPHDRTTLLSLC